MGTLLSWYDDWMEHLVGYRRIAQVVGLFSSVFPAALSYWPHSVLCHLAAKRVSISGCQPGMPLRLSGVFISHNVGADAHVYEEGSQSIGMPKELAAEWIPMYA